MDLCHQLSAMRVILLGGEHTHTHVISNERRKRYTISQKKNTCNNILRTHLCRSVFLEHRPPCQSEEPLRSVVSNCCQHNRAFYEDTIRNFYCSRLKNLVFPWYLIEKCIHCILLRDTSQFYALQPRWRWYPVCIKGLDSGDWVQDHPQS